MQHTEYVVNMQKYFLNIPDAVRKHKKATLPKLKNLYHKTSGINPKNKYYLR